MSAWHQCCSVHLYSVAAILTASRECGHHHTVVDLVRRVMSSISASLQCGAADNIEIYDASARADVTTPRRLALITRKRSIATRGDGLLPSSLQHPSACRVASWHRISHAFCLALLDNHITCFASNHYFAPCLFDVFGMMAVESVPCFTDAAQISLY